jgi:hypothetical protein
MTKMRMMAAAFLAAAATLMTMNAFAGYITVKNMFPTDIRNPNGSAWITMYKQGQIVEAKCVPNTDGIGFSHVWYDSGFKIRAEIVQSTNCRGRKICDTEMGVDGSRDRSPYRATIYVHAHARLPGKCYLGFREKQEANEAIAENMYRDRHVWITLYDYMHQSSGRKIVEAGCVAPGQKRSFYDDYYANGNYVIRAEVKAGSNGNGNDCSGRTLCDTSANPQQRAGSIDPKPNKIYPNGNNCFIDWK